MNQKIKVRTQKKEQSLLVFLECSKSTSLVWKGTCNRGTLSTTGTQDCSPQTERLYTKPKNTANDTTPESLLHRNEVSWNGLTFVIIRGLGLGGGLESVCKTAIAQVSGR